MCDLICLPPRKKTVGYRQVFIIKVGVDSWIDLLKAHFVVKGYTQVYGMDYSDTFSLVAKIPFVKLLLPIPAIKY